MSDTGNQIRALRNRLGMSAAEFSAQFGFHLRTLQGWEQGRHDPPPAIASYLRVIAAHPDIVREVLAGAPAEWGGQDDL